MNDIEIVKKICELLETDESSITKKIESLKRLINEQKKRIEELENKLEKIKGSSHHSIKR